MNSYYKHDTQPPTELYDPEDPSIDDDVDQKARDAGQSPIRKPSESVSVPVTTNEDDEFGICPSSTVSDSAAMKALAGSSAFEQHIGGSLIAHSQVSKLATKSPILDMFSCDGDVAADEKLEIEESSTIRSFDSRLNRLLDSGMLNVPLTLSPFVWKSKRSKKSQVLAAQSKQDCLTDEEVESASKSQVLSSVCVPRLVRANQLECNDAIVSSPPKFLKPPDDDEEEGQVFSPPHSLNSDQDDDMSIGRPPRLIRLIRNDSCNDSLEEPEEDTVLNSTSKPPRVIRLDRDIKRTPSPASRSMPDRATSPAEVSESNRLISGDTPAEPLRIIRLDRNGSPQEKPRIIQLDRVPKSNSESAVQSDELDSSTDDLRELIEKSISKSRGGRSPPNNSAGSNSANKSRCPMKPEKLIGSPGHKSRDRDQERKSGKVRSVNESKIDEPHSAEKKKDTTSKHKEEKYYQTSSKISENHHLDNRDRKRQLVDDKPRTKENHDISKRHKYDDLTPDSDGETHRRKSSNKSRHLDRSETPESKRDRHGSKHEKHRRTDDNDRHKSSHHGARSRRSDSYHSGSSQERDRSSRKHKKRSKSKEKTTASNSGRNRSKHDKEKHDVDSNPAPATSIHSSRKSSRSPHKKHKHSRGSRSHSHKHKSKTHRRKHKRSRSLSEKHRVSRSASNSRKHEKVKKNKAKNHEDSEHHDESSRHNSRYSPAVHRHSDQLHDRSFEEKEKSISHVNHSSSHVHAENYNEQERKHSTKQSTVKEYDHERSLSLLEVCMKTKYGEDFDPIVLQSKRRTKSHSDDDVEILGVTYGTDEELPASCKFSAPKTIPIHRKKDSSHHDYERSSSFTMENDPVSPKKVLEHNINDDVNELQSRTSHNESEDLQSDRNSDSDTNMNSGMTLEFPAEKSRSEDVISGLLSPEEQAGNYHGVGVVREADVNLRSIGDVDDTVYSKVVDDRPCNSFEEAAACGQTDIPSISDQHIPGICEDGTAAAAASPPFDSMLTSVVAADEEIRMISSPEPESNLSEHGADMDNASQVLASVLVVPLERIVDQSFSSPETNGNEPLSIHEPSMLNISTTTAVETHALDASHMVDAPAVVVTSSSQITSNVPNADVGAAHSTNIEKSPFSPVFVAPAVKHNDIVACDIEAKVPRSNTVSSPLYTSNIMSSSRLEVFLRSANKSELELDDGATRVTTNSSLMTLQNCGTVPTLSLPERTSLSVVSNARLPSMDAISTLPQGFRAVPALSATPSTRFALPSTPLPLLPRYPPPTLAASSSHPSSPQAPVPLSTATATLPSIIQSLFVGKSGALQNNTVEELQRLSVLFKNQPTVSSSIGSSASISPLVSVASKTTSVPTSATSSSSGPTMASQLLASLINLSKSSKSSASVAPSVSTSRAPTIDFNTDDVASPKSDESISFSPPSSIPAVIVPHQKQQKPVAKTQTKRKEPELTKKSSAGAKIEKKPVIKNDSMAKIAADFKPMLKPYYSSGKITKEEYKEIMRKAVPQICQSRSGDLSKTRMARYADAYVNKVLLMRKYLAKKNKTQQQPPAPNKR